MHSLTETVRKLTIRQHQRIVGMTTTVGDAREITNDDVRLADEIVKRHGVPGYYGLTLSIDGQPVDFDDNVMS
jgi:hypothetical protein